MEKLSEKKLNLLTSKARADKAINSLKGILIGINSDQEINKKEINELQIWVTNHKELINRNPFREFMSIIEESIKNNIPKKEAIEDLYWLCQKYENDNVYYNAITSDLQILQGICHGILADGIINDKEVYELQKWLDENTHLSTYYPYDEIRSLVLSIVADGKIEKEEKLILKTYLNQFVIIQDEDIRSKIHIETNDINISGHCTSNPEIDFDGKVFCITGVLKSGNRATLEKKISDLGGISTKGLTKKTDYLIVGDNGNPTWTFACYGRKVEKALDLRKKGHKISLVHEFDFMDAIAELT